MTRASNPAGFPIRVGEARVEAGSSRPRRDLVRAVPSAHGPGVTASARKRGTRVRDERFRTRCDFARIPNQDTIAHPRELYLICGLDFIAVRVIWQPTKQRRAFNIQRPCAIGDVEIGGSERSIADRSLTGGAANARLSSAGCRSSG